MYEAIYQNAELIPGYSRYRAYAAAIKFVPNPLKFLSSAEPMYWAVSDLLLRHGAKARLGKGILEIGSGFGYLTYALSKRGHSVLGIDLSQAAVDAAVSRFGPYYRRVSMEELHADPEQRFGIVILTEVIEHIETPLEFLNLLLKLVAPGGAVIMTTPNRRDEERHVTWNSDLPPVHMWWFSQKSIEAMSQSLECSAEFVDFLPFHQIVPFPKADQLKRTPTFRADYSIQAPESRLLLTNICRQLLRYLLLRSGVLALIMRRRPVQLESGSSSGSLAVILHPKD
jgi:SAM-dependent methyltransferase